MDIRRPIHPLTNRGPNSLAFIPCFRQSVPFKTYWVLKLVRKKIVKKIVKNGKYFNFMIKNLASKYNLKIKISGIEAITSFNFISKKNVAYKTFITQEILKKKYLASNQIYLTIYHTKKIIDSYIKKLDPIFKKISFFEKNNTSIKSFIKNKVCHQTFQRLN